MVEALFTGDYVGAVDDGVWALLLGGGAVAYPRWVARREERIDVAERSASALLGSGGY